MDARLPTKLWVSARLALWNRAGHPAVLRRRGDEHGGTIILAIDRCNGTSVLLGQQRDLEGALFWAPLGSGAPIDSLAEQDYLERAAKRDRDIWILGVEAADGWPPLDEPVISG